MNKKLKINLNSQREIQQEGSRKNFATIDSSAMPIGRIKKEFFLAKLNIDFAKESLQKGLRHLYTFQDLQL